MGRLTIGAILKSNGPRQRFKQNGWQQSVEPSGLDACLGEEDANKERMMNWDQIKGNWKQMTGSIKENWGKLTDDEIQQAEGNYDQLVGKIQERYGIGKEEAKQQVDEYAAKQ